VPGQGQAERTPAGIRGLLFCANAQVLAFFWLRGIAGGMETLKVGDWVRTKEGHSGAILLVTGVSAFIEIEGHEKLRGWPFPLSELIKIDPPQRPENNS
jgi:hypothetical protein